MLVLTLSCILVQILELGDQAKTSLSGVQAEASLQGEKVRCPRLVRTWSNV